MVFKKKGRMIDVGELQRRGVVRIPKEEIRVETTNDGFVDMGNSEVKKTGITSNSDFFGFMDNSAKNDNPNNFSTEANGYTKREVDAKITELDNKIYRLENRLEVVEKKLGVNQSTSAPLGVMGW